MTNGSVSQRSLPPALWWFGSLWPALVLPVLWWLGAGDAPLGPDSVDRAGHLWAAWHATREPLTSTTLLNYPEGVDLLPVLGGWLDVLLGAALTPLLGLARAYNAVLAIYLVIAALGGRALAQVAGAGARAAWVAGILLQLDGFVLSHALSGRAEQAGLGFVALALAAATQAWRRPGWRWPVLAGLAGALVVAVSWELTLLLFGMTLVLGLALLAAGRTTGALQRWGLAALVAGLLAGPWVAIFLQHTGAARATNEGFFTHKLTVRASIGLLSWFGPTGLRPSWGALAALVALPLTVPRELRRSWLILGFGMLLALALALGPVPRLWQGAELDAMQTAPWGLYALAQRLPVLGWYHWPDRLTAAWSLGAAVAAALLIQRLFLRSGRAAALVAALLLGGALGETLWTGRWPAGGPPLPAPAAVVALGALPELGAVLDLPPRGKGFAQVGYQLLQISHGRPIRFSIILPHLVADRGRGWDVAHPLIAWAASLSGPSPRPPPAAPDFGSLESHGYRFIALHSDALRADRRARALSWLTSQLGEPDLHESNWRCWTLKATTDSEPIIESGNIGG